MSRYVALLRAINVGGRVVKMDRLRSIVEGMGFERVATFIASGNVLFDADETDTAALEQRLEREFHSSLGYEVATFIRTPSELKKIATHKAFKDAGSEASTYVMFLRAAPSADVKRKLVGLSTDSDAVHVNGRELYWLRRLRSDDSRFYGGLLEKTAGMPGTMRNITTVHRLVKTATAPA